MPPRKRGRGPARGGAPVYTLPDGSTGREVTLALRLAGAERRLAIATERETAALAELRRVADVLMASLEPRLDAIVALALEVGERLAAIELIGRGRL
jgi:hypothetical protein